MITDNENRRTAKIPTFPQLYVLPSSTMAGELILPLLGYRVKLPVTAVMRFPNGSSYYVCPRCCVTMEREFMSFCSRCGQHLDWSDYKKAQIVYPG